MPTACHALARMADRIAADEPAPRAFLVRLGHDAAGIRSGPLAAWDLMTADGTSEVGRFAGTARAVTILGARPTLWVSEHLRRDSSGGADGRLTELAVEFAVGGLDRSVATAEAGDWIRERLCAAV